MNSLQQRKEAVMKKLILKKGDIRQCVVCFTPETEEALCDLISDTEDPDYVPRQINELTNMIGYMSLILSEADKEKAINPYYISPDARESLTILPDLYRFFSSLKVERH